jgi:hypothetical protein
LPSYWGIRTSKEKHDLIGDHLSRGMLRQGWGGRDLREIQSDAWAGRLEAEGRSVWRYTQRMLDIEPGDIVITPHQLQWHQHGVWRVVGPYEFDPLPNMWEGRPDFGHVIRVEPIGVIDHRSASVSAQLRRALTSGFRRRMRQLQDHATEIEELLVDPNARRPTDAAEHFERVREKAREGLYEALRQQYSNADFERPVGALLETLYPSAVRHSAGPAERGRDFVIHDIDTLGLTHSIIVQVKAWHGHIGYSDLEHGLAQLKAGVAAEDSDVDLAVLLTLADTLPPDADREIAIAEEETSVRIRVLLKEETLDLMLNQLAHMKL